MCKGFPKRVKTGNTPPHPHGMVPPVPHSTGSNSSSASTINYLVLVLRSTITT